MKNYFKKFVSLGIKRQALLSITFMSTGFFRMLILFIPFKHIARIMGVESQETPYILDDTKSKGIESIRWSVITASRYTPWQSLCMVQALTAQLLLRLIRVQSTIYLGLAKDEANQLIAHAWLRCGDQIITGGNVMDEFKMITCFASKRTKGNNREE